MDKIVIVTGTRGVGKTTLLKEAGKLLKGVKIVNFGDVMLKICIKKGLVKKRDELRDLSNDVYRKIKAETIAKIAMEKGKVLLDTHATVPSGPRYIPGMPGDGLKKLHGLSGLVYVDTDNKTISERRANDKKRHRERQEDIEMDHQRIVNLSTLTHYSTSLNIPLYIIVNSEGKFEEALGALVCSVKDAFGEE